MKVLRYQRGQAIFETAVVMPLLLLALFGMLYGIHAGIVSERTAVAARYAAAFTGGQGNFKDYGLSAMVSTLTAPQTAASYPCSVQSNTDVFSQSNEFALAGGVKDPGLLHPASSTVRPCMMTSYSTTATSVPILLHLVRTEVDTTTSNSDSWMFGPNNLFGMNAARQSSAQSVAYNSYPAPPQYSLHCLQDLVTYVGRSLKIHGIYSANSTPGYGNYRDDIAVKNSYPANGAQPLTATAYGAPTWSASCNYVDTAVANGPGTDPPIAAPGGAWWEQHPDPNGSGNGYPGENIPYPASVAGDNPPPGPLSTLPGPDDFNGTDPGVGVLRGGI